MRNGNYQRTILALQKDTLDAIAHRVYADRSFDVLPRMIEINAQHAPTALLPYNAIIVLPDDDAAAKAPSIKLWD